MKFGAHESIKGGVYAAIERARDATCDVVQIFNKSNSQWRARKLEDAEVERYFELVKESGIAVVCSHSSYLINLASPDPTLNEKSFKSFEEEVRRCNRLEIPSLVFHPGSHVGSGEEAGMDKIGENLNRLSDQVPDNRVCLCLEATAGQGSNLGYTFEQLAAIIDRVDNRDQMGVCLDTCHIFAAGYPISEPAEYKKTMQQLDQVVGLERLKVLHLNDSKKEFGSRRDRHEHIGEGHIGCDAFRNVVNDRRLARIPMIIETPKEDDLEEDRKNLKVLRSLVKKVPTRRRR